MCILEQCQKKGTNYGSYCFKHRHHYLMDGSLIRMDRFTRKPSDYLKKDIIRSYTYYTKQAPPMNIHGKQQLFQLLDNYFQGLSYWCGQEQLKKVQKIQSYFREKKKQQYSRLRGEGFVNPEICQNDTDFFSYETWKEIDPLYFFSYRDHSGFVWFFDLRSFQKLVDVNQGNPYTREEFPDIIKENASRLIQTFHIIVNEDPHIQYKNRKQKIKQMCIDIFSRIEQTGYECNFEWFLKLRHSQLKALYRNLEDLWNYRAQLSSQIKSNISPPCGLVFNTPVLEVMQMGAQDIQELLLCEVKKFESARTDSDQKLGYMYFIIGLGSVSQECHFSHPWLAFV